MPSLHYLYASCVVDGDAIACDDNGLAVFDLIRYQRRPVGRRRPISLCAFDLLELDGRDMRSAPIEERKEVLAHLLCSPHDGIAFNENFSGDGATIYKHACGLGCEGIVSKQLGSPYRAGRSSHWVKVKNPKGARGEARSRRGLELSHARYLMLERIECRSQ